MDGKDEHSSGGVGVVHTVALLDYLGACRTKQHCTQLGEVGRLDEKSQFSLVEAD